MANQGYINGDGHPYAGNWLDIWSYAYQASLLIVADEGAAREAADTYLAITEEALAAHANY